MTKSKKQSQTDYDLTGRSGINTDCIPYETQNNYYAGKAGHHHDDRRSQGENRHRHHQLDGYAEIALVIGTGNVYAEAG